MADRLHLRPKHRQVLEALLQEHLPGVEVWACGSRVSGRSHDGSDLDLVLRGPDLKEIPIGRLGDFEEAVRESTIPFLVEARDWTRLPKRFHREIERHHVVLVAGDSGRLEGKRAGAADEWLKSKLGNLLLFSNGKTSPERTDGFPYPVYGSNGIIGFSDETNAPPNTTVIGRVGSYCGSLHYSDKNCWVTDNAIRANAAKGNDAKFLFYLLQTLRLNDWRAGSGQPLLNQTILSSIPVMVPPLPEQRAIAHILGTLDDKIELNRRMNETLEAMARALFKSWFVEFDPVRAKMAGRDPGLPQPLADLFPGRLVDSELGKIPEGWGVADVESLCVSITSGGTPSRKDSAFWEHSTIPWYKTGELLDGPLIDSEEYITEAAISNSSAKLWPAGTILFALYASPTVGRLGVLEKPGTANQATAGLIVKSEYGVPFLRRMLIEARGTLKSIAVGAAQQNINQQVLKSHRLIVPRSTIAGAYSRLMAACDDQQVRMAKASRTLAGLRDVMLPKLVSGELRMDDVKRFSKKIEPND
ncbi:MAG: restriction endonuclease subunit S [Bryobacterales bacterium]|nr:restriction endonuclease subunit S [Bryobacterales bacterium]